MQGVRIVDIVPDGLECPHAYASRRFWFTVVSRFPPARSLRTCTQLSIDIKRWLLMLANDSLEVDAQWSLCQTCIPTCRCERSLHTVFRVHTYAFACTSAYQGKKTHFFQLYGLLRVSYALLCASLWLMAVWHELKAHDSSLIRQSTVY